MEFIHHLFSEELISAFGWTVVHSLWQAAAIAALMSILMIGLKDKSAKVRYAIANLSLLAVFLLAVITFLRLYNIETSCYPLGTFTLIHDDNTTLIAINSYTPQSFFAGVGSFFDNHMPFIVVAWFLGILFFTMRLMGGVIFIQYLRSTYIPLPEKWFDKMEKIKMAIPLHTVVELAESALVKVPMVVGHLKPIILLPIGVINQLETGEVEAIIAHELAHIARNDYFFNILQSVIEIIFYYNPAVWLISANIRTERENSCDDMAVKLCGNSLAYAKALVKIQEVQHYSPRLAMTFAGSNKNQLLNRVKRILNQQQNKSRTMEKLFATCLLLLTVGLLTINARSEKAGITVDETNTLPNVTVTSELPVEVINQKPSAITRDTLPKTNSHSRSRIRHKTDNESVSVDIENGEIQKLNINGKRIPKEDYHLYEDLVTELMDTPPVPPAPPAPPAPPMPPMPFMKSVKPVKPMKPGGKKNTSIDINIEDNGDVKARVNGYKLKQKKGENGEMITYWEGEAIEEGTTTVWENGKLVSKKIGDSHVLSFNEGDSKVIIKTDEDGNTQAFTTDIDIDLEKESDEEILEKLNTKTNERELAMQLRDEALKNRALALENRDKNHDTAMKLHEEALKKHEEAIAKHHLEIEKHHKLMEKQMKEAEKNLMRADRQIEKGFLEDQTIFRIEGDWDSKISVNTDDIGAQVGVILYEEGLITDPDDFSFRLRKNKMKVNGKTIVGAQVDKVEDLLRKRAGFKLRRGSTVEITKGAHNSKSSIKNVE